MKLVKLFIAFVVISLIIGIGLAFNGGKKNVAPPNQSQNENQTNIDDKSISPTIETDLSSPEEMTNENVVTETATIPEELSGSNNVIQPSPENHEQKVSSEVKKDSSKTTNSNQNSQNITTNNQTQKPESVETKEPTPENDKSVDTSSIDYSIHRGRIDCYSSEECMNKSIPIQFKFNNSIINSYYVEVKANDNSTLGYFIEYVFSESNYSSPDECNKVGNEMKQTLPEKINSYQCIDSTLKINTSY